MLSARISSWPHVLFFLFFFLGSHALRSCCPPLGGLCFPRLSLPLLVGQPNPAETQLAADEFDKRSGPGKVRAVAPLFGKLQYPTGSPGPQLGMQAMWPLKRPVCDVR